MAYLHERILGALYPLGGKSAEQLVMEIRSREPFCSVRAPQIRDALAALVGANKVAQEGPWFFREAAAREH